MDKFHRQRPRRFYWKAAFKTFLVIAAILAFIGFLIYTPGKVIGIIMLGLLILLGVFAGYIVITLIYGSFAEQERRKEMEEELDKHTDPTVRRNIKYGNDS